MASDGSGFTGDARATGGYLDATYARGYLSAAVRYTDLRHETRRSIGGIDGLQQPLRAKYSNDAISARVEHVPVHHRQGPGDPAVAAGGGLRAHFGHALQ